jgi:hypothetical protein
MAMAGADFAWWPAMRIAPRALLARFLGGTAEDRGDGAADECEGVTAIWRSPALRAGGTDSDNAQEKG